VANPAFSRVESKKEIGGLANLSPVAEKENPEDRAGSTGVDQLATSFMTTEYRKRAEAATSLCLAIAECEPEDAAPILEAALISMTAGAPIPALLGVMDQAAFWADMATPPELDAYALACVNRMAPKRKAAFLAYVGGAA
jgi:hypothetical protein